MERFGALKDGMRRALLASRWTSCPSVHARSLIQINAERPRIARHGVGGQEN